MLPGFPRRVPRGLAVTFGDPSLQSSPPPTRSACEDGPVPSAAISCKLQEIIDE